MGTQMAEEMSKEHNSIHGEVPDNLWQVEVPLDPSRMVRAEDLSSVLPALKKVNCQPGQRTLVVNAVKISKGEVNHAQDIVLDTVEPPRISCLINNLFPNAPEGARLTLVKRYSEFQFRPNTTASEGLEARKLELQVCIFWVKLKQSFKTIIFSVLV